MKAKATKRLRRESFIGTKLAHNWHSYRVESRHEPTYGLWMRNPPARPPLNLKDKGDLAELMVAADLRRRGFGIALPFGEDNDFDLILIREDRLERVQVKYVASDGVVVPVRCRSHSLTNGKVRRTKHYTAKMIDILAVYDDTSKRCYYLPSSVLGDNGRSTLHLRLRPTLNGQRIGIRLASDYLDP